MLDLNSTLNNNQDLGIDVGYNLSLLKAYFGPLSAGPAYSISDQVNLASIDLASASFDYVMPEVVGVSDHTDITTAAA